MTSDAPDGAFVWTWLPGASEPVVAGRLTTVGDIVEFNYGRSYLNREQAIPLYLPELPLRPGVIAPANGLRIAGCIDDAGPDAWGQRVVMQHLLGAGASLRAALRPRNDTAAQVGGEVVPTKLRERRDRNRGFTHRGVEVRMDDRTSEPPTPQATNQRPRPETVS